MTEKRFTLGVCEEGLGLYDNQTKEQYLELADDHLIRICALLNELHEEKEFWKSNCCSQDNFNRILLNELSIAQEQGYKVSDPFKKLMEDKGDVE